MRIVLFTLCTILGFGILAQTKVERGTLGIGLHLACPQGELRDIEYDDGWGLNLSYLTRGYPYQSPINVQFGARMDFAAMNHKDFTVDINTPVPDDANMEVRNNMYGLLALGRMNFGYNQKVTPYVDFLAGHRNYGTHNTITANNPELNPDYESISYTNRVVFTKRFHYGMGIGATYELTENVLLEAGATYTVGGVGAAMPLPDVNQANGSNEVIYEYSEVRTDILLINTGFRFKLYKHYRTYNPSETTPSTPTDRRYKDTQPPPRTSDPVIKDRPSKKPTTPKKKAPIEIKPDGPKKGGDVGH